MPARSLAIVDNKAPLRGASALLDPLSWNTDRETSQPRALRSLAQIINGGLCHRCGTCVGICPTSVLTPDAEGYPQVTRGAACTDCDLCVKVCPGDEFNFQQMHEATFSAKGDSENTHGHFSEGVLAYATDTEIREHSTSGGLVTALLIHLLETNKIDGALVIGSDDNVLWKGKPRIARTREELIRAMKSKYAITPTNSLISEIRSLEGRYAVVGLPCQIHGIVKAKLLDERIRERVVLTIGLFCHAAIEHEAFEILWNSLGNKTAGAKKFISRIGKHPGTPHLELSDGSLYPVYFGNREGYRPTSIEMINILYRLYTPSRCLTCFDALAEFADISIGDPWMAPPSKEVNFYEGWSFALIRSAYARTVCEDALRAKKISLVSLTKRESLACNTMMAHEKRWRAYRIIETHRRQGKSIPEYRMPTPVHSVKHFIKTELHMLSHIFCFLPKIRGAVLKFMLSSGGYYLLWLNHKRRAFRFWRRDSLEKLRRIFFGRN